jgi:zinc transporter, ZIP family
MTEQIQTVFQVVESGRALLDAMYAMVSETMIPEAFHGSPQFNGLLLVVGFVALLILLVLSH